MSWLSDLVNPGKQIKSTLKSTKQIIKYGDINSALDPHHRILPDTVGTTLANDKLTKAAAQARIKTPFMGDRGPTINFGSSTMRQYAPNPFQGQTPQQPAAPGKMAPMPMGGMPSSVKTPPIPAMSMGGGPPMAPQQGMAPPQPVMQPNPAMPGSGIPPQKENTPTNTPQIIQMLRNRSPQRAM